MDHFTGITPQERYNNDMLNEFRQIRKLLERIAQTPEQEQGEISNDSKSGFQRTTRSSRNAK